jgi:hypothetical protein
MGRTASIPIFNDAKNTSKCVFGAPSHSATKAFAKAATTMDRVDLWRARFAMNTPSKERRVAIAEAVED